MTLPPGPGDLLRCHRGRGIAPRIANIGGDVGDLLVRQIPGIGRHRTGIGRARRRHRLGAVEDDTQRAGRIGRLQVGVAGQRRIDSRRAFAAANPEALRAFLAGWFDTIAYMKTHKAESVAISAKVLNLSEAVIGRVYDEQIGAFNTDGTFDPKAVAVLKKSYIEMGLLKDTPDDKEMFTTQFVPVKVSQQ